MSAEYNFFKDPEAAKIVFHLCSEKIALIPIETALSFKHIPHERLIELFETVTPKAQFIKEIFGVAYKNWGSYFIVDPIAIAVAIDPEETV